MAKGLEARATKIEEERKVTEVKLMVGSNLSRSIMGSVSRKSRRSVSEESEQFVGSISGYSSDVCGRTVGERHSGRSRYLQYSRMSSGADKFNGEFMGGRAKGPGRT